MALCSSRQVEISKNEYTKAMAKAETKRKTLVVIDGKSVFYRGYYAMPNLSLPDGTPTGGVYGFAVMALEVVKRMRPDYVVVAWDKPKTNIRARLAMYDQYKANRKPAPDDFYVQIPLLHRLLEAFGWPMFECDDYEADDIMGTVALQANKEDVDTILITSDLDLIQVVNHHTKVAALKKGLTNIKYYDEDSFRKEFKLTPEQFIDVKALKGDSSDNIPGVGGVGEKTGLDLICTYGSLDGVYEHIEDIKPTLRTKLEKDKDMAYLSKKLVTILLDAPVKLDLKSADVNKVDPATVAAILTEFQFKSLLAQLPASWKEAVDAVPRQEIKDGFMVKKWSSGSVKDIQKSKPKELILYRAHADSLLIGAGKIAYEVPRPHLKDLSPLLAEAKLPKVGFDMKYAYRLLDEEGVSLPDIEHDVRIGAFLINPLQRTHELGDLVGESELTSGQALTAVRSLHKSQTETFKDMPKLAKLAREIEWPIILVLARMENAGIPVDKKYLAKMSVELADKISDTQQEIYGHAGMEFNISSPSQLAEVLFEKIQLPKQFIKKTKSGYSTAATELDKLRGLHPVIDLITHYREFTKLKGTYVDALPKLIADDGRLHSTFALDVAATGRLSSHDPNLQNIPVRTEVGKLIRRAFVADKGTVFISADYSQFELRLAAALADEKDMIKAFNEGLDVHQLTASQIYGIKLEDVTKEQRYSAKAVNFGIMYGLGAHGLSVGTGMSMAESREFIEKYFAIRPKIKAYTDQLREQAKDKGYVETLFGRRRPTPDVKSSNFVVREGAYRAAVNMPMQGTAADIMKMAMIKVQQHFDTNHQQQPTKSQPPRMLLQIHDSILVETPEAQAEQVASEIKDIMENVYKLPVKLAVDTTIGKNWGEM
jgi:DNA polymerase-1